SRERSPEQFASRRPSASSAQSAERLPGAWTAQRRCPFRPEFAKTTVRPPRDPTPSWFRKTEFGLSALKVSAGTPVPGQSHDLRDRETSLFLGHLDRLADAGQGSDPVEQHVPGGRRNAEEVVLLLSGRRLLSRGLVLGPDVHLDLTADAFLGQLLTQSGELGFLGLHSLAQRFDQIVAVVTHVCDRLRL